MRTELTGTKEPEVTDDDAYTDAINRGRTIFDDYLQSPFCDLSERRITKDVIVDIIADILSYAGAVELNGQDIIDRAVSHVRKGI